MGVFNMKNHLGLGIISVLTVFVQSCAPSTAVRVLSLSYRGILGADELNNTYKDSNLLYGPKKIADWGDYVFPGDILTFTVELEDPNFEFISLLAIKFNGQTIRANSDDSIVTTRDCGANICVDFPFEIQSGVTQYEVEEVKFAKLSSESGVNAIIDNRSLSKIILNNLWDEEIYPNVIENVNAINDFLTTLEYKTIDELISMFKNTDDYKSLIQEIIKSRTMKVYNPHYAVLGHPSFGTNKIKFPSLLDSTELFSNNDFTVDYNNFSIQLIEFFNGSDSEFISYFSNIEPILDLDFETYLGAYNLCPNCFYNIYFGMLDESFAGATAFNKGNDIYLMVNGQEIFLYQTYRYTYFISY